MKNLQPLAIEHYAQVTAEHFQAAPIELISASTKSAPGERGGQAKQHPEQEAPAVNGDTQSERKPRQQTLTHKQFCKVMRRRAHTV